MVRNLLTTQGLRPRLAISSDRSADTSITIVTLAFSRHRRDSEALGGIPEDLWISGDTAKLKSAWGNWLTKRTLRAW